MRITKRNGVPLKELLGVWVKDRWRYERALRAPSPAYLALANRRERLKPAPDGIGWACHWRYTSVLHAPGVQPRLGSRLLSRCLADAPIVRCSSPSHPLAPGEIPQLSVLIGHRGEQRLPLLLATLESLAAQREVRLECLVIEQDDVPRIACALPAWVRHVHARPQRAGAAYNRSHTFNVGSRHARGRVLLLHDNDMLVPERYCQRVLERIDRGFEVINPKRFVFYLDQEASEAVLRGGAPTDGSAGMIVQNLEAGGSMAILADTYRAIGGMDETFVGWGGEDNEFWDRCQTRPTWIWGYEPIVHLWHPSQPHKLRSDNPNLMRARELMELPAATRIASLVDRRESVS
jgi:hypothetical protein